MHLIVNADDLGASPQINDAAFDLMGAGLVTSATMMCNAPAFEEAAKRAAKFDKCSFGVHLNLTQFEPLSSTDDLAPLLDENWHLSKKTLETTALTPGLLLAAHGELSRQVERALRAGVAVSHFDSHHHIHTIPALYPVLKSLQRKFGIRRVRPNINLLPRGQVMSGLRACKSGLFRVALRHFPPTRSPDGFGAFRDFHSRLECGTLECFRSLELMVHPGTDTGSYKDEIALLRSGWRAQLPSWTVLGSYHAL